MGLIMVGRGVRDPDDQLLVGNEFAADPRLLTAEIFYMFGNDCGWQGQLAGIGSWCDEIWASLLCGKHAAYAGSLSAHRAEMEGGPFKVQKILGKIMLSYGLALYDPVILMFRRDPAPCELLTPWRAHVPRFLGLATAM